MSKSEAFDYLLALMRRLDAAHIHYSLDSCREGAVMIEVTVPGERWEIELVEYADKVHVEVEIFRSKGVEGNEATLEELFEKFSD